MTTISDRSVLSSVWLAFRSLLWTFLLPGFFAGYLPWRFFGLGRAEPDMTSPASLLGLACIGLGVMLLAACIFEFARSGRGTLSPVDPPRRLVVRGLYRYVRNPMYLAVAAVILGQAAVLGRWVLVAYAALFGGVVWSFVHWHEEPTLRRRYGAAYEDYVRTVPGWRPRRPR
jgi:protein-S-isoprenylcysteine O-methyltransferase Ste14